MIKGEASIFAIESEITRAFESVSWRGLGFFVIHVAGRSYGIKAPGQSMLACSIDEVQMRIARRGLHQAPFSDRAAIDIADAFTRAVYLDIEDNETFFGMSATRFTKALYSVSIVWAPDGDEAFDDGSYVLQFDVDNQVRVIAFTRPDALVDPSSVREVWLPSDTFYAILREWSDAFIAEWKSLPKHE
jgi:hypothetical protein